MQAFIQKQCQGVQWYSNTVIKQRMFNSRNDTPYKERRMPSSLPPLNESLVFDSRQILHVVYVAT